MFRLTFDGQNLNKQFELLLGVTMFHAFYYYFPRIVAQATACEGYEGYDTHTLTF